MLNCALGSLFLIAVGIFSLIRGAWLVDILTQSNESLVEYAPALSCLGVCVLSSMNIITAPSISLEGKSLWIARSLPVSSWQILKAKLGLHLLFTCVPALICSICFCIALGIDAVASAAVIIIPQIYTLLCAVSGLRVNLRMPNLNWSNESVAVKQSLGVLLAMFIGWAYAIVLVALYMLSVQLLPSALAPIIPTVFLAVTAAISVAKLKRKGVKRFEAL